MAKCKYYHRGKRCSKGEKRIASFLDAQKIAYDTEKTFDECRNKNGHKLRYDFYLPQYKILIEYNGEHHYAPINDKFHSKVSHKQTQEHDDIKLQFAKDANYNLLIIPHWDYDIVEQLIVNAVNYVDPNKQLTVPGDVKNSNIDYAQIIG